MPSFRNCFLAVTSFRIPFESFKQSSGKLLFLILIFLNVMQREVKPYCVYCFTTVLQMCLTLLCLVASCSSVLCKKINLFSLAFSKHFADNFNLNLSIVSQRFADVFNPILS